MSPGSDPGAQGGLGGGGCGDAGPGLNSDGEKRLCYLWCLTGRSWSHRRPDGRRAAAVGGGRGERDTGEPLGCPPGSLSPFPFQLEHLANQCSSFKTAAAGGRGGGRGRRSAEIRSEPFCRPLFFRRELSFAPLTSPFLTFMDLQAASIPDLLWALPDAGCCDPLSTLLSLTRLSFLHLTTCVTTRAGVKGPGGLS